MLLIVAPSSAGAQPPEPGPVLFNPIVMGPDDTHSVNEDSGPSFVDVLANDGDTAVLTGVKTDAAHGSVATVFQGDTITGFTYDVNNNNYNGPDSFEYEFTSGEGDEAVTSNATVTITIEPVADPPVAAADELPLDGGTEIVEGGDPVDITAALLNNDSDPDADSVLTIVAADPEENAAGTVILTEGGVLTYEATSQTATTDLFEYSISDGTTTSSAEVTINITPFDNPPVVQDDTGLTVVEGSDLIIDVQKNDDVDGGPNTIAIITPPAGGTATLVAAVPATDTEAAKPEMVKYEHLGGEDASDSFTYSLNGQTDEATGEPVTATVSIEVTPVNDAPVAFDDTADADEANGDTPGDKIFIDVVANDEDVDDEVITVASVEAPGQLEEDGTISYQHTTSDLTDVVFNYTLAGGQRQPAQVETKVALAGPIEDGDNIGQVTITINNVDDDAPVAATPVDLVVDEDEDGKSVAIFEDGATDDDGNELSIVGIAQGSKGTAVIAEDGFSVVYTPNPDANGEDSFVVTVTDGDSPENNDDVEVTVLVSITPVNDAPVAVNDRYTENPNQWCGFNNTCTEPGLTEDFAQTLNLLGNDGDIDSQELSVSDTLELNEEIGTLEVVPGGVMFTPAQDYHGEFEFDYTITDGEDVSNSATVTVRVYSMDDPLETVPVEAQMAEDSVARIDVLDDVTDVDETGFGLVDISQPEDGFVSIAGDQVRVEPDPDFEGTLTFNYTVRAHYSGHYNYSNSSCEDYWKGAIGCELYTNSVTVTVTGANDRPEALRDSAITDEDEAITIDVLANDTDSDNDILSIDRTTEPKLGTVEIVANEDTGLDEVLYTPSENVSGNDTFIYYATDGDLLSVAVVYITINPVNDDPTIVGQADLETLEDTVLEFDVVVDDVDLADSLTLGFTGKPVPGVTIDGLTVTYAPVENFHGSFEFDLQVTDDAEGETQGSATASFTVTVASVNDAPEAEDVPLVQIAEEGVFEGTVTVTDVDDTEHVTTQTTPSKGKVFVTGSTFVYEGNKDANGVDSFVITYTDDEGGFVEVPVSVEISPVNDDPTIVGQAGLETLEDTVLEFDVVVDDVDLADSLTLGFTGKPVPGVTIDGLTVTYAPVENFHGSFEFDLQVTDDAEGETQGSATASFTVTVASVNDAPEAEDVPSVQIAEEGVFEGTVTVTDVDGDLLSATATDPDKGEVELAGTKFFYTGALDEIGEDSFTITYDDNNGGTVEVPVSVEISPVNDDPTIEGQTDLETLEDHALQFTVVVDDVDDDDVVTLELKNTDLRARRILLVEDDPKSELGEPVDGGFVKIAGTSVTFTPNSDFHGVVNFELLARDQASATATAEFTITVIPVNDLPVITAEEIELDEDASGSTQITITDVEDDFADVELTATVKTQPTKGTVAILDGEATYTGNADAHGDDSFVLSVTDSDDGTGDVEVDVVINPMNDVPVAGECASATVASGESVELDVSGCASDIDGDALVVVLGSAGSDKGAVSEDGGTIAFTPAAGITGDATIEFLLTDGSASVGSEIVVKVTAPAATPSPYVGVAERDGQLVRIYAAMLGRLPDREGFNYWSGLLEDGLTIDAMVEEFGRSREFKSTYGDKMANDSDADWIEFVYRQVLGRQPEAKGRAYWGNLLASGDLSRADMVVWFAEGDEFKRTTQTL